jgi:starvation-inducible DNA-binding protein
MPLSANVLTFNPPAAHSLPEAQSESRKTVEVLEELLAQSIHLRDLYKNARWQTANIQYRHFQKVLDGHYREQIHLVDVLVDRIRALDGADRVFAHDFLHGDQLSQILLRGRASITGLFSELIDAHDLVLSTAQPAATSDAQTHYSWTRDFAVGQVVLTNDLQMLAISQLLMDRERRLQTHATWVTTLE